MKLWWYTIVLTYDNNNLKLFINGTLSASTPLSGNLKVSTSPILIAKEPNKNIYYDGEIEDVLIFNTSLSQEEIDNYFQNKIDNLKVLNNLNNNAHNLILYYDFSQGKSIPIGTIIKENNKKSQTINIKSYYTWIPRYKYKVWNIEKEESQTSVKKEDGTIYDPYQKQMGIDIIFENSIESTGTIDCSYNLSSKITTSANLSELCHGKNGEYYTHPAFNIGTKGLTGFWVGKFESTIDENNNTINIKNNQLYNPTKYSLSHSIEITNNITSENNIYDFNPNIMNSHLIKNTEWGAISYLTYSNYGLCQNGSCSKMGLNNYLDENNNYQTGCGSVYNSNSSKICNDYNADLGQKASTTSNIYGVYDMSGGTSEYVSATSVENNNINELLDKISFPYYDMYSTGNTNNDQLAYNRTKLGDAIGEISLSNNSGWENSTLQILTNKNNILLRGGNANNRESLLSSIEINDIENNQIGTRAILIRK